MARPYPNKRMRPPHMRLCMPTPGRESNQGDAEAEESSEEPVEEVKPAATLPVNFGKRLAHTDKTVRDKGFSILKKWLAVHPELERLEYMKLWKGLYFGMWMADKRPVQQELSVNTAMLLNDVPREKRNMWIETFWETMRDAWEKLDVHRINKYMLFMRIILAESFK
ncbi:unnamed protein product, partial [Polarella glacialis]